MAACRKKKPSKLPLAPAEHTEFTEFVRKAYIGVARKHDGYLVTMRQLRRARAADAISKWCWYSELLAQRGLSLALARPGETRMVQRFYDLMPLPALTVFVLGPPEVLIKRNRKRVVDGKDDRSACVPYLCEITPIAVERLRERGANMLVLDALEPVEANAGRVWEAVGDRQPAVSS